jgi:hypothetical protein
MMDFIDHEDLIGKHGGFINGQNLGKFAGAWGWITLSWMRLKGFTHLKWEFHQPIIVANLLMVGGNEFMFMNFVFRQYVISHPGLVSAQIQRDIRGNQETQANLRGSRNFDSCGLLASQCALLSLWTWDLGNKNWLYDLAWIHRREIRSFFWHRNWHVIHPPTGPGCDFLTGAQRLIKAGMLPIASKMMFSECFGMVVG